MNLAKNFENNIGFYGFIFGVILMIAFFGLLVIPGIKEETDVSLRPDYIALKDKKQYWSEYNLAGNPYVTCNELVYIEGSKIYCTSDSFDTKDYNITVEIPQLYNCEIKPSLIEQSDKGVTK